MKKNKLTIAVAAGIAGVAGMANAAQYVNPEGTGELLLYPYYSVRNGLNTLYSVVNTTNVTKAVKVRFLEGENSEEVLDFNIYMSPYDVWTGALIPVESSVAGHVGENSGAHVTSDTSCAPFLNKELQEFLPFEIDKDFVTFSSGRVFNNDLNRSREGHIEIMEMATFADGTDTADAALHATSGAGAGVPDSCATIAGAWGNTSTYDLASEEEAPEGGLFGSASIVNVGQGLSMTYDAVAVADFWADGVITHTEPGDLSPSIANGDRSAIVFNDGVATTSTWANNVQAVSALLMRNEIYNEYAYDSFINGKTEWVVTFPTKHFHVNFGPALAPFTDTWNGTFLFAACEEFEINLWDREEQNTPPGQGTVSPAPPQGGNPNLCYEANVIEFVDPTNGSNGTIFDSNNLVSVTGVDVAHATENGWARLEFISAGNTMTSLDGVTYDGLPVLGFAASQFTNANAAEGLLAQYAGLFTHKGLIVESSSNTTP